MNKQNKLFLLIGVVALFVFSKNADAQVKPLPEISPPQPGQPGPAGRLEYVSALQRFLNKAAIFPLLSVDGKYGNQTEKNVNKYLQREKITPTQLRQTVEKWNKTRIV
jgi:peptidoglycan hydrolase-like protein with peptidoglycan-binding domain